MGISQSVGQVKTFANLLKSVIEVSDYLDEIDDIELAASQSRTKLKAVQDELSSNKEVLEELNKKLEETNIKASDIVKSAKKEALSIIEEAKKKIPEAREEGRKIVEEAKQNAVNIENELTAKRNEITEIKKSISDKNREFASILSEIDKTKATLRTFVGG